MKQLDELNRLEKEICDYFGFQQGWRLLPIVDERDLFWMTDGYEFVTAETEDGLGCLDEGSNVNGLYSTGPSSPSIYRRSDYTLALLDLQSDINVFASVFDNTKERPWVRC